MVIGIIKNNPSGGRFPLPISSIVMCVVVAIVCSYYGSAQTDSPQSQFKPHAAFSQYAGSSCSNAKALFISGNAQTNAQLFQNPSPVFGGSIRSNADIKVTGNGYVNGDATPAPGKQVILNGNGTVTGSIEAAPDMLNCSIEDLNGLAEWVQQNHQNNQIPQTDQGRLPWGCGSNPPPNDPWQFCLKANETIHIPAGIYWFSSWSQSGNSKIIIDGYVRILVSGSITLSGNISINADSNQYDLLVFTVPENNFSLQMSGSSTFNGLMYSPGATAHFTGQSVLNGAVIFNELKLSGQAQLIKWIDEAVPEIAFIQPNIKCSNTPEFSIEIEVSDEESGIDPESIYLFVNSSAINYSVEALDPSWHTIKITTHCDSVSCGITDGINQIMAEVRDRAGNDSQVSRNIIIDMTPPVIGITYPANEDLIKEPSVIAIGNVWDEFSNECGLSLNVNNMPMEIMPDGSWFTNIFLEEGANPIEAVATDGVGNSATHEIVITYPGPISPVEFAIVPQFLIVDEHPPSQDDAIGLME